MKQAELLKKLKEISRELMSGDKYFHDFTHVMNVYKNAEKLLRYEKADRLVLLTAVLFHDVKRGKNNHGRAGAVYVKKILKAIPEFPSEKINFVAETIATHSNKYECKSAEQKLLYDADKMDTFTELGIVRAFMIYSQQKFNLKNACFDYVNFLNSRYKKLNTKTAKKLVGEDYQNAKKISLKLVKNYYR